MMKPYLLRTDLTRETIGGFALPLGIKPVELSPPQQGYTVMYAPADENMPDSYSFHVVVSHDRLRGVVRAAFKLLSDNVFGIIEIGSRDAYRTTDVYIGDEPLGRAAFLEVWDVYEDYLLEDGGIGVGANSEDPFLEIFIDQWKGMSIHVPLSQREQVEEMLVTLGLEEVTQTWSEEDSNPNSMGASELRPVLDLSDDFAPDVDEVLLQLRHAWSLVLDIEPDSNKDEKNRELGRTLWHVVLIAQSQADEQLGAYVSVWLSAESANEVGRLITDSMEDQSEWEMADVYSLDRVAFDDRPETLESLPPRLTESRVHLIEVEPWSSAPTAER